MRLAAPPVPRFPVELRGSIGGGVEETAGGRERGGGAVTLGAGASISGGGGVVDSKLSSSKPAINTKHFITTANLFQGYIYSHFLVWSLTKRRLPTQNHPLPIEYNAVAGHEVLCAPQIFPLLYAYIYTEFVYISVEMLTSDDVNLETYALQNAQAVHHITLLLLIVHNQKPKCKYIR